ncbi:MAG: murein hydrolase activator EnvC family protein [Myxococcota bacterium]
MAAGLGVALLVAAAPLHAERDRELEELRGAIESSRERVGRFEREERALLARLEEIDRRSTELSAAVRRARERAEAARARLGGAEAELAAAESALGRTRQAMSRRAVALYKAGEGGPVALLFSTTSMRDFLSRWSTLRAVLDYDAELVDRFARERDRRAAARAEAERATAEHEAAVRDLRARRGELAVERKGKGVLLAAVREDRGQERALLIELERAARALEETLTRLGDSGSGDAFDPGGPGFASRRGRLSAPVDAEISQRFGRVVDREFLTQTFRNGVEFAAAAGESVRAIAPGQVRFAGWFRGYGRIVILDHGSDYFTVSGHLDEIFVSMGDPVGEGDTIGTCGETGSLSGPSLYFEIREGSRPVDPSGWLGD